MNDFTIECEVEESEVRVCHCCGAQENQLRLVGNFTVELSEIEIKNESVLVCQSCRIKDNRVRKSIGLDSHYVYVRRAKKNFFQKFSLKHLLVRG